MPIDTFRYVDGLTNKELEMAMVKQIGKEVQIASCTVECTLSQTLPTSHFLHCFRNQKLALQLLDLDVNTFRQDSKNLMLGNLSTGEVP